MAKPKLGVALGSGGARGWVHVGVLQGLKDAGYEPDVVAGCSMGALVGGAFAAGWLDELEAWGKTISRTDILKFMDFKISSGGLIEGSKIMDFLKEFKGDARMEDLEKPYMAVATDLESGREVWLNKGSIFSAIRASVSIPGFLAPYRLGGKWLVDGGLTNPVPVSSCRALGADVIIAVNPNAGLLKHRGDGRRKIEASKEEAGHKSVLDQMLDLAPESLRNDAKSWAPSLFGKKSLPLGHLEVLASSIDIMTDQIRRNRMASEPPHLVLDPELPAFGTLEFNRAKEVITEGRRIVQQALPELEELMG